MSKHPHFKIASVLAVLAIVFAGFAAFYTQKAGAADYYLVRGWGWSGSWTDANANGIQDPGIETTDIGGIGWISFSNLDDGSAVEYGVKIDRSTGDMSGYAWSPNVGWLSFEPQAGCPSGTCKANINLGTGVATGWARFCSVYQSGCSGALKNDAGPTAQRGDWDGWISLSGPGYAVQFNWGSLTFSASSYAWGGNDGGENVVGWGLNFAGLTAEVPNINAQNPPNLSFYPGQAVVFPGNSTTLYWVTSGEYPMRSCTASGAWGGSKATSSGYENTGAINAGPVDFNLQCTDIYGGNTPLRTATVNVMTGTTTLLTVGGTCGAAAGGITTSAPVSSLCGSGSVKRPPGVMLNTVGKQWQWYCTAPGFPDVTCTSTRKTSIRYSEF